MMNQSFARRMKMGMGILGAVAVFGNASAFAEQWGEMEKLTDFLGSERSKVVTNLKTIEAMGLTAMGLAKTKRPWSDSFWPDVNGSIAYSYADAGLITRLNFFSWSSGRSFVVDRKGLRDGVMSAPQSVIDNLAPSEKYDLLLGDTNFTLTNKVVEMLDVRNQPDVDLIASWSGVCHGWSPASLTLDRPKHSFQLMSPLGRMITFYPADVKALSSFLWGKSLAQNFTKVEGWQCQTGARTNKYGRLADPRCFDVNPAFLHLIAVNQIGVNKRGFVMDRSYRTEVQNQPTYAYSYKYFSIQDRTPKPGMTLSQAMSRKGEGWDPYRHYRNPKTQFIVGVELTLWYAKEGGPNHETTDDFTKDNNKTYTTRYDLELDAQGEIIGGEWREYDFAAAPTLADEVSYQHPDIIWLVPAGLKATSIADGDVESLNWDGLQGSAPEAWRQASIRAANYVETIEMKGKKIRMPTPQPLAKVVDLLIQLSNQ